MTAKKTLGVVVAAAAVAMLATGYQFSGSQEEKNQGEVKCAGINSCKGQGACAAADGSHACAGHNECKGKGWVKVKNAKACEEKGGTVIEDDEEMEEE